MKRLWRHFWERVYFAVFIHAIMRHDDVSIVTDMKMHLAATMAKQAEGLISVYQRPDNG
jgi:hypothetical protein